MHVYFSFYFGASLTWKQPIVKSRLLPRLKSHKNIFLKLRALQTQNNLTSQTFIPIYRRKARFTHLPRLWEPGILPIWTVSHWAAAQLVPEIVGRIFRHCKHQAPLRFQAPALRMHCLATLYIRLSD
jgi:hypothetical protein